jgi:uncharacterized protein YceK
MGWRAAAPFVALATACAANGCGTFMNLQPPAATGFSLDESQARRPYGGVLFDAEVLAAVTAMGAQRLLSPDPNGGTSGEGLVLVPLLALDLPICAVLDTVTLPVTVPWTARRWGKSLLDLLPRPPTESASAGQPGAPAAPPPGASDCRPSGPGAALGAPTGPAL